MLDITFKMNLVSRLAVADCAGNINISEHTCTILYHQQDHNKMDVLEVLARYFSKILQAYSRTQYFLSN